MHNKIIHFVPLLTLVRSGSEEDHPDLKWDKVEFMDLNFDERGESIAVCDGEPFYLKNERVRCLFKLARDGRYKISTIGYSTV